MEDYLIKKKVVASVMMLLIALLVMVGTKPQLVLAVRELPFHGQVGENMLLLQDIMLQGAVGKSDGVHNNALTCKGGGETCVGYPNECCSGYRCRRDMYGGWECSSCPSEGEFCGIWTDWLCCDGYRCESTLGFGKCVDNH